MNTFKINNFTARDLWEALHDAGLLPDNCRDFIIEARFGEAVKIHCQSYADERIVPALAAFVKAAKVDDPPDGTDRS